MRNLILYTLLLLAAPFASFSQDRVDDNLLVITDTVAHIDTATGWIKNNNGKWVSRQNAIPTFTGVAAISCESFVRYALFRITYKGEKYFCLQHIESGPDGKYLYYTFWVFYFVEKPKAALSDTTLSFTFYPLSKGYTIRDRKSPLDNTGFSNEILKSMTTLGIKPPNLYIDAIFNSSKNYIRFYIDDRKNNEMKRVSNCGLEQTALEKYYYETDFKNGSGFFERLAN